MRPGVRTILLLASLSMAAPPAHAESMNAAIPFQFRAGDKEIAAGKVSIGMNLGTNQLSIRGPKGAAVVQAVSLKFMGDVIRDPKRNELIFNRYGERYFLAQVWIRNKGMELLKSGAETEAAAGGEGRVITLKVKSN